MLDLETAKHHGVCPVCEGYGGRDSEKCEAPESGCIGHCPDCWCEGCQDAGSWAIYESIQATRVHDDQMALPEQGDEG